MLHGTRRELGTRLLRERKGRLDGWRDASEKPFWQKRSEKKQTLWCWCQHDPRQRAAVRRLIPWRSAREHALKIMHAANDARARTPLERRGALSVSSYARMTFYSLIFCPLFFFFFFSLHPAIQRAKGEARYRKNAPSYFAPPRSSPCPRARAAAFALLPEDASFLRALTPRAFRPSRRSRAKVNCTSARKRQRFDIDDDEAVDRNFTNRVMKKFSNFR